MKTLSLFIILSISGLAEAKFKCTKKVDSKRVVLFVDTNESLAEAENAEKAACTRGESFKKIPDKEPKHIEAQILKAELINLAKNNIAVASMVISGHDGGGSVHGINGGVGKFDIINSMKAAYKTKPDLLEQFNSVFMWGCWTMGPSEVDVWRQSLPSLKMAAGFFDMGPLNTTEASRTVLHDLLVKEKAISAETDAAKVKRAIASVTNINQTYASVYAETCDENLYYYNTKGDNYKHENDVNFTPGTHFVDYDKHFDCSKLALEIEANRLKIMDYYYGIIPIPTNTSSSPLRSIYSFVRSNSKCIKANHTLNGDRILMLIFSQQVKENFSNVFSGIIKQAEVDFSTLNRYFEKENPKGKYFKDFKNYFMAGNKNYFSPDMETLKSKDRKQIIAMIKFLDGLTKQKMVTEVPLFASRVQGLKRLKNAMENYLYQMNPNCMNFLEWHEVVPGKKPFARCRI